MLKLGILVAYFAVIITIGWWSRKRVTSRNGFFVAHRSGGSFLITGSLLATIIGGSATIGMAGWGFERGLTGAWWLLAGSLGLLILTFFASRRVRKARVYTLPELVERQYGPHVSMVASILIVVAWTGVVAGQIVAAGTVLSVLGAGSITFWMIIFSAVFITYTIFGGQYSIIRTDFVQTSIILAGILVASALVLVHVGGLSGLGSALPPAHFSFPTSMDFGWRELATLLIIVGSTYVVGPDIYTRLFCARDENTARRSTFSAALFLVLLAFAITLIGMGAKCLSPAIPSEQAFPYVITEVLPFGVGALVLAALIAALMSSADTCLLSQSVILTQDVMGKIRPKLEEKKVVLLCRLNALVLGILAMGLALVLKGIISSLLFAYTIFTCGLVVPVVAGFYKERLGLNSDGAIAAVIGGGLIGLLGKIPRLEIPLKEDLGLVGFAVSAILLFAVSLLTNKFRNNRRKVGPNGVAKG